MNTESLNGAELLEAVTARALEGVPATVDEAMALERCCTSDELCGAADRVRDRWCGNRIDTCSIVNARSGRCTEDCKWCAQSRHFSTGVNEYDIIPLKEAVNEAVGNCRRGVARFSLVTSGRKVSSADIGRFCDIFRAIKAECGIKLCASMGLLSAPQFKELKEAGVERYHCNLETSSSYFPRLCTTHTHQDKLDAIAAAREAGLDVCSGGIIGMGETMRQRLELACEAREAGAVSMPVNLLQPIKGTALEHTPLLSEDEVVRSIALMRLVAPKVAVRFAGGRARLSEETTVKLLRGGVSGSIVGDMLTTIGKRIEDDYAMYESIGRSH